MGAPALVPTASHFVAISPDVVGYVDTLCTAGPGLYVSQMFAQVLACTCHRGLRRCIRLCVLCRRLCCQCLVPQDAVSWGNGLCTVYAGVEVVGVFAKQQAECGVLSVWSIDIDELQSLVIVLCCTAAFFQLSE